MSSDAMLKIVCRLVGGVRITVEAISCPKQCAADPSSADARRASTDGETPKDSE